MGDYDPKLPTLLFTMPQNLSPENRQELRYVLDEHFHGRYNVVVVQATSAILLPPEDPNG